MQQQALSDVYSKLVEFVEMIDRPIHRRLQNFYGNSSELLKYLRLAPSLWFIAKQLLKADEMSSFLRDRLAVILGQVESASNGSWAARKPTEDNGKSKVTGPNKDYQDNDGAYRRARDFRGPPRYADPTRLV